VQKNQDQESERRSERLLGNRSTALETTGLSNKSDGGRKVKEGRTVKGRKDGEGRMIKEGRKVKEGRKEGKGR
jgi:hypothetical protein